uniref:synaptonemal complex central element protein 3 isoform X1 n=1 Tax=Pristiophorus japonicus TaxID=55135 RepID=UPI00398EB4FD
MACVQETAVIRPQLHKDPASNYCMAEHQKILKETIKYLGTMLEDMDQLYVQTQLLLCDLTICFNSPAKMEAVKRGEESYKHHREIFDHNQYLKNGVYHSPNFEYKRH